MSNREYAEYVYELYGKVSKAVVDYYDNWDSMTLEQRDQAWNKYQKLLKEYESIDWKSLNINDFNS